MQSKLRPWLGRVTETEDTKIEGATNFTFIKEDHTMYCPRPQADWLCLPLPVASCTHLPCPAPSQPCVRVLRAGQRCSCVSQCDRNLACFMQS
jgi:hypothetical protein